MRQIFATYLHAVSRVAAEHRDRIAEMEPGHGSPGHWVSDFDRVGSGYGSVCQIGV